MRCIVIGGGVIGLLSALLLGKEGLEIIVLERTLSGRESSWAAGGILAPLHPWKMPQDVNALFLQSEASFPALANTLAEETGVDPHYHRCGMLVWEENEQDQAAAWAAIHHIPYEILSSQAIAEMEPGLRLIHEQALWFPSLAQIRPPRFLEALRRKVLQHKISIIENTEVVELRWTKDQICAVATDTQVLESEIVVVAAGAWSQVLLHSVGIEINIHPVRGQIIAYDTDAHLLSRMVESNQHYLIPRRDGLILAGSTVENAGFCKETTEAGLHFLHQAALELMPCLQAHPVRRHWAGLRPGTDRAIPLIAPHPTIQGLYLNTGHYRNGIALAPASAQLLADLVFERPWRLDPAPYAYNSHPFR